MLRERSRSLPWRTRSGSAEDFFEASRAIRALRHRVRRGPAANHLREASSPMSRGSYLELKKMNRALRALRVLTRDTSIETLPVAFNLSDVSICNLTCPHCATHGTDALHAMHNSGKLDVPRDAVVRLLDEGLPAATYFHLTVGGEPFYSPNFDLYVEKAVAYQARVQIVTNGTLLRRDRFVEVMPFLHSVGFSVDGASRAAFEALRRGAKLDRVLRNIDLIVRSSRKVQRPATPFFYLSFVIMNSNLVELPHVVRLAHQLGVPNVQAYFIQPPSEPLECERPSHAKPLYNAALSEARGVARELRVELSAPDPFPGVAPSWDVAIPAACRLASLPADRGWPASLASIYDSAEVEREAADLAERAAKAAARREAATGGLSDFARAAWDRLASQLDAKLREHEEPIRRLRASPESTVSWCNFVEQSLYVGRWSYLCCMEGAPRIGVPPGAGVADLWSHEAFRQFRAAFLGETLPPICATCHERRSLPANVLLAEVPLATERRDR
jgi:wyosine [tRNA(Phe)-imidazoG37] synthetase (radical SAM superfamily)